MAAKTAFTAAESSHQITTSTVNTVTTANQALGTTSTIASAIAARFTAISVPQNARINRAMFRWSATGFTTAGTSYPRFTAHASDDSPALAATNAYLSGLSRTTAVGTPILVSDMPDGFTEVDVTAVVQELVERAGWTSGSDITMIVDQFDNSTTATATSRASWQLVITYDCIDTGWLIATANSGSWTNPTNAYADGTSNATMDNSTNGAHRFSGFNFGQVPTGATIVGIEVRVDAWCSSNSSASQIAAKISKDSGTNYATEKISPTLETTEGTFYFGLGDVWDITVAQTDLGSTFYVSVRNAFASATNDGRYDFVSVRILYDMSLAASPTTVLNTPADAGTTTDTTPTVEMTATDPQANPVSYGVQIDTVPWFRGQNSSPASTNLVLNPSFENLTTGWADNWTRGAGSVYTVDTGSLGQSPSATNSLKITHAGEAQQYCKSAKITIDKTKVYYWSFTIKVTAFTSGSIDWNIEEFNSGHSSISNQYLGSKAAVGTFRINGTYTPTGGAGGSVAEIEFQFFNAVGTNTAYVDQVEVFEVNAVANVPKVSVTFDDGWENVYTNKAAMTDRAIPVTWYITSDFVGTGAYTSWVKIAEMANSFGWQIGNHTKDHTDLTTLTEAQIVTQISTCQSAILSNTGITAVDHAYPYGSWDEEARMVITRYCRGLRTFTTKGSETEMAPPYEDTTLYGIKVENTNKPADVKSWIDEAILQGDWLILVFHELVTSSPTQYQYKTADAIEIFDYINLRASQGAILPCTMEEGRNLYYKKVPLIDKISSADSGFANTTDGADTDPFDSAEKADYDVQSALSLGTYYWRARAKDPAGSNLFGPWATTRSFVINAAAALGAKIYRFAQAVRRASSW